jgi:predicted nucleic acid-binding protein
LILVDSSVWIDFFRGTASAEVDRLDDLLGREPVVIGDIILTEVLQGFTAEHDFDQALRMLGSLDCIGLTDHHIAVQAARNFRLLRSKGITVGKTIDTIIATRCIEDDIALLFSDRDFQPFVDHLGLVSALRHFPNPS